MPTPTAGFRSRRPPPSVEAISTLVREAVADAWAVLSPVRCAGCGADDRALCIACRMSLEPQPVSRVISGLRVTAALDYEGPVRRTILAFKEQGRTDVAGHLARPMAAAIHAALAADQSLGAVELVTVPTGTASFRRRGYDPVVMVLAATRLPRRARVLRRVRDTAAQKTLDRESRARNSVGSFRARHPLDGRSFLIVDDVATTGSTLREAARAIEAAGGAVVGAAVVAATPKRFGESAQEHLYAS